MPDKITCTVTKSLAVLGENAKGYTKEVNLVSWNNATAKLDIREWHPEHEKCGKGIPFNILLPIFAVGLTMLTNKHLFLYGVLCKCKY